MACKPMECGGRTPFFSPNSFIFNDSFLLISTALDADPIPGALDMMIQ